MDQPRNTLSGGGLLKKEESDGNIMKLRLDPIHGDVVNITVQTKIESSKQLGACYLLKHNRRLDAITNSKVGMYRMKTSFSILRSF
jgi:hypothetical protein